VTGIPDEREPQRPSGKEATGRKEGDWIRTAVRVGLIALFAYLLWGIITAIDWTAVVDGIGRLSATAWGLLLAVSALRILTEAWLLRAVMPGLGLGRATLAFLAPAAAASVLPNPADLVARFGMYTSWGYSANDTTLSVVASWLFTTGAKITLPIFAAVGLATIGRANADVETIAVIAAAILLAGIVVLLLVLRSERLARRVGHRAGQIALRLARPFRIELPGNVADDLADRVAHFRETGGTLIRQRWRSATAAALAAQFSQYLILLLSLRGVGVSGEQLHPVEIFAAFALVQLITVIPITPGGIGIAEAAYVSLLVAETERALASLVTAGTLVYRLFSWILLIPLGGLAWLWWRRTLPDAETRADPPT